MILIQRMLRRVQHYCCRAAAFQNTLLTTGIIEPTRYYLHCLINIYNIWVMLHTPVINRNSSYNITNIVKQH